MEKRGRRIEEGGRGEGLYVGDLEAGGGARRASSCIAALINFAVCCICFCEGVFALSA
jgi:hypothetical protein